MGFLRDVARSDLVLLRLRRLMLSPAELHLEVLALRHQLQVLERSRPQPLRLAKADRWLWAWRSRSWHAWRTALVIVKPSPKPVRVSRTACRWRDMEFPGFSVC